MKNIVLIRHGESLGQTAHKRGMSRSDPSLKDCFLSKKGVLQASELRSSGILDQYSFDLVCTSPLSRALSTCILALGNIIEEEGGELRDDRKIEDTTRKTRTPFIARADLCEFGKGIPENQGTPLRKLKKIVKANLRIVSPSVECVDHIDFSMLPPSWPNVDTNADDYHHNESDIDTFLNWLESRPEKNVAVVCHFNVIRWMLNNRIGHVPNCTPIECILTDEGELFLKSEFEAGSIASKLHEAAQQKKKHSRKKKNRTFRK